MSEEQIGDLIKLAERAARGYITSRLPKGEVDDLQVVVEADASTELIFNVEVFLDTVSAGDICQELANGAVEAAHATIENELKRLRDR